MSKKNIVIDKKLALSILAMMCAFDNCKRLHGSSFFTCGEKISFGEAYNNLAELDLESVLGE